MAIIPGSVRVGGFIAPSDSADTYAAIDNIYGRGGWREVPNITARDAITTDRRREGMAVYVQDIDTVYILKNGTSNSDWVVFTGGGGDVQYPITVDKGGTGTTLVASGNLLFGDTSTALSSSPYLNWDNVNRHLDVPGLVLTTKTLGDITAGQLEYDGTSLYFSPTALVRSKVVLEPVAPELYTITNHSTLSRTINARDLTMDQIADIVCTIIKDLSNLNLLSNN